MSKRNLVAEADKPAEPQSAKNSKHSPTKPTEKNEKNENLRNLIEHITKELNLQSDKIDLDSLTAYIAMRIDENGGVGSDLSGGLNTKFQKNSKLSTDEETQDLSPHPL